MSEVTQIRALTPEFRMSFPNLIQPRAFQDKGDQKNYRVEMLFEPEDLKKFRVENAQKQGLEEADINQILLNFAKDQFPGVNVKQDFQNTWPVRDGSNVAESKEADGKRGGDVYRGKKFIRATSGVDFPPNLMVVEDGKKVTLNRGFDGDMEKAANLFVGGHYAFAEVVIKAVEVNGIKYMPFYLNSICFTKIGEKFGGQSLMARYDDVSGGSADVDPTAGSDDDEIPF